ncbi:LytR/AlgR family response regulator transcription factor [Floricoccus penangensis]|uniref:LytR/AlgR family response regulator transcription factor n=1 Tax=Floricoccus penangensis TaxID=1859475 RepID=UPI00203C318D|nr:LytTR family transcriptional regulator DNA-binding domain-containing protein [Floricoccus penangensis]URZ86998.1 LytTR family transcriptional regulator DNA-binding domain-containing protein [Floricoccus penangensis]
MHVLIVDDEPLAREELNYIISQNENIDTIDEAESVDEAMSKMIDHKPDILFLDIHLTDESGFDLAEKLVNLNNAPYLIFATAYDEYALKAFQVNAKDYILKPFDEVKIEKVLKKAFKSINFRVRGKSDTSIHPIIDSIPIQTDDRIYLVAPDEIYLVSVEERQLNIMLESKSYQMTGSLNKIEEKLPNDIFIKTHRSFILNANKIKEIQPWFNNTLQVIMDNDLRVPVSRSYIKNFKEVLGLN